MKNIFWKCRIWGHKMKMIWQDNLPSSTSYALQQPGMPSGGSLSVKEDWGCERCPYVESRRGK